MPFAIRNERLTCRLNGCLPTQRLPPTRERLRTVFLGEISDDFTDHRGELDLKLAPTHNNLDNFRQE